jgi:NAD(P)-dependent dehydrogenase (short-subunit alcohol dehydrogenase family)
MTSDPKKDIGTVLITGAARGLGLEFARQFTGLGWNVHATVRSESDAATLLGAKLDDGAIHVADVRSDAGWAAIADTIGQLDLLINNAGVNGPAVATGDAEGQELGTLDFPAWQTVLDVNLIGQMRVTQAMLPALRRGRRRQILFISSLLGSIAHAKGDKFLYRSSKAALNMAGASLSKALEPEGFAVGAVCPGWVRTRMGGASARLSPSDAVAAVIANIALMKVGEFVMRDEHGATIPW